MAAMDINDIRRDNLRLLMDRTYGVGARGAQTRLGERLNRPQNYISRCLFPPTRTGAKNIGEDFARDIEKVFSLPPYAMDLPGLGENSPQAGNVALVPEQRSFPYPVISSVAAGNWAEAEEPWPLGEADEHEFSSYRGAGLCFWLEVKGDSMTAPFGDSFPDGTLVLVDTGLEALPGKLVVAKRLQDNEATFKQLVSDAGQKFLKPLNPAYPMLPIDQETKFIGVVKESKRKH